MNHYIDNPKGKPVEYDADGQVIIPWGCRATEVGEVIPEIALAAHAQKSEKPDYWSVTGIPGKRTLRGEPWVRIVPVDCLPSHCPTFSSNPS